MKIEKNNIGGSVSWVIEDDKGDFWRYTDGMVYRTAGAEGCAVIDLEAALDYVCETTGLSESGMPTIPCPPPADYKFNHYHYRHSPLGHFDPEEDSRATIIPPAAV